MPTHSPGKLCSSSCIVVGDQCRDPMELLAIIDVELRKGATSRSIARGAPCSNRLSRFGRGFGVSGPPPGSRHFQIWQDLAGLPDVLPNEAPWPLTHGDRVSNYTGTSTANLGRIFQSNNITNLIFSIIEALCNGAVPIAPFFSRGQVQIDSKPLHLLPWFQRVVPV